MHLNRLIDTVMKNPHNKVSNSHRFPPALSTLALSLLLAGCATAPKQNTADTGSSPLVVRTSVGQEGWHEEPSKNYTPPPPKPAPRRRSAPHEQAEQEPAPSSEAANKPSGATTMLNFVSADLQGVVRAMARFTGRNFVVDPRVKGQLTLVSEAPVDSDTAYSMLLSALRMQGFAVVEVDGVSRVVPEADAKLQGSAVSQNAQTTAKHSGELMTRVFQLKYENAASLVPILRPMVAPNNPINAYTGNNTLVVTDYADNLDRIAKVIARIDTPKAISTDVVPIQYGVALDVAALAAQLLDNKTGGDTSQQTVVLADPRTNSVLLRATSPEKLKLARNLVERIDSPESQEGNLHVVYLRNAQATKLAQVLRGALGGQNSQGGQLGNSSGGDSGGLSGTLSGGLSSGSSNTSSSSALQGLNTASSTKSSSGQNSMSGAKGGTTGSLGSSDGNSMQSVGFTAGGATVQADPSTNTLIISAPAPLYRSLREVIDQLDQRRAQVLVESLIVEVNADNAAEFGIQWMAGGNDITSGKTAFIGGANLGGTGLTTGTSTTIDALAQGLSLGVVNGTVNVLGNQVLNLGVLARALQSKGGANVLSTPNLMTLDNEEASIMVGRTVPFVTGQYTTTADGASNPFQTITREDVGLTLRIRPQISEGGTVKLALYQEVSSLDGSLTSDASTLVTRKRALETNVLVDDGQIIVLGGLLEDTINDSAKSVPLLGDIPLLGNLFRYDSRQRTKTNLMIFLRPHIVRNAQDGASLTLDRYNYMREAQAHLPPRSTWFSPSSAMTPLPNVTRNPQTGLLDLREAQHAAPAPAAGAAAPAAVPSPGTPVPEKQP